MGSSLDALSVNMELKVSVRLCQVSWPCEMRSVNGSSTREGGGCQSATVEKCDSVIGVSIERRVSIVNSTMPEEPVA